MISATDEYADGVFFVKNGSRGFELIENLSNEEVDQAINAALKTDETRLIRRLCIMKNLYEGRTQQQAGEAIDISRPMSRRWACAWNDGGIEGLRPRLCGGRPPKLTPAQWAEICALLKDGQPWTPQEMHSITLRRTEVGDRVQQRSPLIKSVPFSSGTVVPRVPAPLNR